MKTDAGDKKSEEQTLSLGTWVVQKLMRKEDSPSQKWNEAQRVLLVFMHAGWLQVPKDHERMKSHTFRNEAPKPFVVWLKMSELLGCCSSKIRIHFYVESMCVYIKSGVCPYGTIQGLEELLFNGRE